MTEVHKLRTLIDQFRAAEVTMKINSGNWRGFPLIPALIAFWTNMTGSGSWYWDDMKQEAEGKTFREMWHSSERGDWLLWFVVHFIGKPEWPTHQEVVLASCQCARRALKYIKGGELRPVKAIERAEAWAGGQTTVQDVRVAADAARHDYSDNTAFCAAQAAVSAAWAVYAEEDGCCFRIAQAASGGASWVGSAVEFELRTHEFGDAAEEKRKLRKRMELRECAVVVRDMLSVPSEFVLPAWLVTGFAKVQMGNEDRQKGEITATGNALTEGEAKNLSFDCAFCAKTITVLMESGGTPVECPHCARASVVPTTISRAKKIADRIEEILINSDYVRGTQFIRLSNTCASTRIEVVRALFIVYAQLFQQTRYRSEGSFDEFVARTGDITIRLKLSVIPDAELSLFSKLEKPVGLTDSLDNLERDRQLVQEELRLFSLAKNDAAWHQLETMESFVAFLKAINPSARDYWQMVYRRIGLPCPHM